MTKMITLGSFDKRYTEQLHQILIKKDSAGFKGKQGKELYLKVKEKYSTSEEHEAELERVYAQRSIQAMEENIEFKKEVFNCFLKKAKAKTVAEDRPFIESNLLSACLAQIYLSNPKCYVNMKKHPTDYLPFCDPDRIASDKEYLKFLRESIHNPVKAELKFRASDHNFLSAKFHEMCDGVENTLTIVRTEFGKTIFAYAAQKWNPSGAYINDTTGRSCIVLLDIKKKLNLTVPTNSIYGNSSHGPTFGSHDLYIANSCNANQNSHCNPPKAYNNGFENNQIAFTTMIGCPSGINFRVVEYEVYKLTFI